jgi:hypothetical protein
MLDWQITENETLPDDEATPPVAPFVLRRPFLLAAIATVVVVSAIIGGSVRTRYVQAENAMTADLLALARAEEQARRFNLTERMTALVAETAPDAWRSRYLALLDGSTSGIPAEISLDAVQINGSTALAEVRVDVQVQRRYYQLTGQGWRRAPMPLTAWGNALFTYTYPDNERIRVEYYQEDGEFAKAVMDDLPALFATLKRLNGESVEAFAIVITPEELNGIVLAQERAQLVVNSPQLAVLPLHNQLTGEEAVRYVIARTVLSHAITPRADPLQLPAHQRFVNALRTVLGLRWSLSPERYALLRDAWRERVGVTWQSPFFDHPLHNNAIDPSNPTAVQAATLLVVDTLYEQQGEAGLTEAFAQIPQVKNWDELLTPITGLPTLHLEEAAQGIQEPYTAIPELPLTGVPVLKQENGQNLYVLKVADYALPIELSLPERTTVRVPGWGQFPAACTTLFPEVTIQGMWREAGLRLTAMDIYTEDVSASAYFTVTPQPADRDTLMGMWRTTTPGRFNTIEAVSSAAPSDESGVPVLTQIYGKPLVVAQGIRGLEHSQGLLLTTLPDSDCPLRWLVYYHPDEGIISQWLVVWDMNENPPIYWDDLTRSGIVVISDSYSRFTPEDHFITYETDGKLPDGTPIALRPGTTEMLFSVPPTVGSRTILQRVNIETGERLEGYDLPEWMEYTRGATFSHDGRYLLVTWRGPNRYNVNGEVATVVRYDMETGAETILWRPGDGTISLYVADSQEPLVYAVTATGRAGTVVRGLTGDTPVDLYRPPIGYDVFYMLPCDTGGVMVVAVQRILNQTVADMPKTMVRLSADGSPRTDPLPIENGLPLLCR